MSRNYAMSDDEFESLREVSNLVGLVDSLAVSSDTINLTQEQLCAFTHSIGTKLRTVLALVEERKEAADALPTTQGINAADVGEIIDLLSGQRFDRPSRWKAIGAKLAASAQIDESMNHAHRAWGKVVDANISPLSTGDSVTRFKHIADDAWEPSILHQLAADMKAQRMQADAAQTAPATVSSRSRAKRARREALTA